MARGVLTVPVEVQETTGRAEPRSRTAVSVVGSRMPTKDDLELTLTFEFYRPPPDAPASEQARAMDSIKDAIIRTLGKLK